MHSTQDITAIATAELYSHLEQQVQEIAPEPIRVNTPQRKAKYHDKARIRFARIKEIALRDCKCPDTAEMKRRLKLLGINLDLRLTSAWIAIAWELQERINAIAIVAKQLLEAESQPTIQVGDRVVWNNAPIYLEQWFPLRVLSIVKEVVQLELWDSPVPVAELEVA